MWNDGRENRNLGEKKIKLERCIAQLLFPKQNKKAKCRLKTEWINKIIISSCTFSCTATSTEDNDNNDDDDDDDDDDDNDCYYYSYLTPLVVSVVTYP